VGILSSNDDRRGAAFSLTSFTSLFGGPGVHGYGQHTIDPDLGTSAVCIAGKEGLAELIGSARTAKLMLDDLVRIEVDYNRKEEQAVAIIKQRQHHPTLENLWSKATAMSDDPPAGNKRKREEAVTLQYDGSKDEESLWACLACTFIHVGRAKSGFLSCELCGSQRKDHENALQPVPPSSPSGEAALSKKTKAKSAKA
jgi:hypothetical protein